MAVVAAVLAVTSPWDTGPGPDHGARALLASEMEEGFVRGATVELGECLGDGIDRELTDADALTYRAAVSGTFAEAAADPAMRAAVMKVGRVMIGCGGDLVSSGDFTPAEAAAMLRP